MRLSDHGKRNRERTLILFGIIIRQYLITIKENLLKKLAFLSIKDCKLVDMYNGTSINPHVSWVTAPSHTRSQPMSQQWECYGPRQRKYTDKTLQINCGRIPRLNIFQAFCSVKKNCSILYLIIISLCQFKYTCMQYTYLIFNI